VHLRAFPFERRHAERDGHARHRPGAPATCAHRGAKPMAPRAREGPKRFLSISFVGADLLPSPASLLTVPGAQIERGHRPGGERRRTRAQGPCGQAADVGEIERQPSRGSEGISGRGRGERAIYLAVRYAKRSALFFHGSMGPTSTGGAGDQTFFGRSWSHYSHKSKKQKKKVYAFARSRGATMGIGMSHGFKARPGRERQAVLAQLGSPPGRCGGGAGGSTPCGARRAPCRAPSARWVALAPDPGRRHRPAQRRA